MKRTIEALTLFAAFNCYAAGPEETYTRKFFIGGKVVYECQAKWITEEGMTKGLCIDPEEERKFENLKERRGLTEPSERKDRLRLQDR